MDENGISPSSVPPRVHRIDPQIGLHLGHHRVAHIHSALLLLEVTISPPDERFQGICFLYYSGSWASSYDSRRGRYWIACARCTVAKRSLSARSAIVRASFRIRWYASALIWGWS
jgi:hypothetical protein